MPSKPNRKHRDEPDRHQAGKGSRSSGDDADVRAGGWTDASEPRWAAFPGPRVMGEELRVSLARQAYADLIGHTKESLDAEVCGVLIGELCEDEDGLFVQVQAVIQGTSARTGSAHVTFTQETWTHIHEIKDKRHPDLQIVGWYHSHPGFGVEFSEMDLFIQRNFFPGVGQIAHVVDPLGGAEAICANLNGGIRPLARFWVEGRERSCVQAAASPGASGAADSLAASSLSAIESRLSQLIQAVDDQRKAQSQFLFGMGVFLGLGVVLATGYGIYSAYTRPLEPPKLQSYLPMPVKIGDHTALLGIQIAEWKLPPELDAVVQEEARLRLEAEEKARKEAAAKAKAGGAASAPAKPGPGPK